MDSATGNAEVAQRNDESRPLGRRAVLAAAGLPAALVASGLMAGSASAREVSKATDVVAPAGTPETSIAELRALSEPPGNELYLVTDVGMEGLFRHDSGDTTSVDDTGTVLVSAAGARFHRVFSGPLNVRWFGAKGDGVADDAPAVQMAVATGQARQRVGYQSEGVPVYLPAGFYRFGSTVTLDSAKHTIRVFGDGGYATWIMPMPSMTELEALFKFTDTAGVTFYEFADMALVGWSVVSGEASVVKSGIYSANIRGSRFERLRLLYFTDVALAIGYGWVNTVQDCEFSHNKDNLRTVAGDVNMLNVVGCHIAAASGTGINLAHSGLGVRITGCTLESISGPAIVVQAGVQALEISNNYFELNGSVAHQFTNPDRAVKADIIIDGTADAATIGSDWPVGPVRVANNMVNTAHSEQSDYFVACFCSQNGLEIANNSVVNNHPGRTYTLLLTGTSKTGAGARVDNAFLHGSGVYWPQIDQTTFYNLEVDDLAGGLTQLHTATIEGVFKLNYASPLVRFGPVSRAASGTWRKAAHQYRHRDVWELSGDADAEEWGFSIDLAEFPELAGKYVYFACFAKASDTSTAVVLSTSQLGRQDAGPAADTDWHVVSYVDKLPETGTVSFSLGKDSSDPASVVSFSHPVLSEVGVRYDLHEDARG